MVGSILDKLFGLGRALSLVSSSEKEIKMTDKCLQGVEQKRERALKRTKERRETAKGGKAVSDWSDDDKYADDKLHKEKQVECYERNRPVKRAMGLP